jgi:hypothetical protein
MHGGQDSEMIPDGIPIYIFFGVKRSVKYLTGRRSRGEAATTRLACVIVIIMMRPTAWLKALAVVVGAGEVARGGAKIEAHQAAVAVLNHDRTKRRTVRWSAASCSAAVIALALGNAPRSQLTQTALAARKQRSCRPRRDGCSSRRAGIP